MNGITPGAQLPELDIPVDRSLIVAGAIASQDFEDVHHDPGAAVRRGSPDTFISINTTNGLVGRYITDWAGPGARLLSVALRLGMPLYPGDVLHLTGEVTGQDPKQVTVKVTGSHHRGAHVTATVRLALQQEAAA
jgi:acyl dehydratase